MNEEESPKGFKKTIKTVFHRAWDSMLWVIFVIAVILGWCLWFIVELLDY